MNVDEIFRQALLNRIGERRFSYWFAGARFSASPSGLIVRVENEFLCAFIRSSFQHELQKICVDVAGVELPIEICCDETPAPAFPTQNQPQTPAFETSAPAFPARSSSLPAIATGFSVQNGTSPQPAKKRGRPRKNPFPQDAERSTSDVSASRTSTRRTARAHVRFAIRENAKAGFPFRRRSSP
jgi:chromosomal replication initiation ATPase DnaA